MKKKEVNACDKCGEPKGTLYDKDEQLVCLDCTGEDLSSRKALFRLAPLAVAGNMNIERRRNAMRRRQQQAA